MPTGRSLRCSVRGCGLPIEAIDGSWRCERGHAFDPSRSGYLNLLQPQDKKSARPGDDRDAVRARRRFLEGGALDGLIAAIGAALEPLGPPPRRFLDVGCGEGFFTANLARLWGSEAIGLDLSSEAADAAARTHRGCRFVVGNADRELPCVDGAFDRVLSITARKNPAEFARVLAPEGDVLLVVAGADDLAEVREAVMGRAPPVDRRAAARAVMAPLFREIGAASYRTTVDLDRSGIADVLAMTYRGARRREAERAESLERLRATLSADIVVFKALR